jgi:subtilisin family serine protease
VQYFNYTDSYADAWGLDRVDQRALPLSATSTYGYTGAGIRVYILDTGLQTSHPEFGGRAQIAFDAFGGTGYDCEGHGTHVAGTVGGNTYGVAKGAMLRGVKVLRGRGCGTESWDAILAGLDWVYKYRVNPAVVNMSLGGGYWQPVNDAVTRLANAGVFVAVAAGNENQDACKVTPASAPGTFTVAASTRSDTRVVYSTWGSNWGGCVDAYAPGDEIMSAWPGGRVYAQSGTSMAAPHVAGVAALYKHAYGNAASSTIVNWLIYNSTKSAIRNDYTGTPNRLLWKGNL